MSLTPVARFRFCHKCACLFREAGPGDGTPNKCPAGGVHEAMGYTFEIPAADQETPTVQIRWESCSRCIAMFYNGFPGKGRCPGRPQDGHIPEHYLRLSFGLMHDVPPSPKRQTAWRFCTKCFALFFDGFPDKGRCTAGGAHTAEGWDFALLHHN